MSQKSTDALTYRDAGVDIDAGNQLVDRIKGAVSRTRRPEVLGGIGGFGGLFEMPTGYKQPVMVSGTDGVGTKLKLAMDYDRHDGIGIDLVAMCVNDIIVTGAEPLFFLDYYATGKLDVDVASRVVAGIADGCELAGCALVGGETAEMPGMYHGGDYDLAGFSVGVVEKSEIIDGSKVAAGDVLIGLPASGPHSNGYSLIRKVIEVTDTDVREPLAGKPLIEHLLAPTTIYVKALLQLMQQLPVHALAHITGGGLPENLPRVLPENTCATVDSASWQRPAIFNWLQEHGNIPADDMWRTFNCGVGMVIVVAAEHAERALTLLRDQQLAAWKIGEITPAQGAASVVIR